MAVVERSDPTGTVSFRELASLDPGHPAANLKLSLPMQVPRTEPWPLAELRIGGALAFGFMGTLVSNVLVFLFLSAIAPRENEGVRQVITWPWKFYVVLAHVLPVVLVYGVSFVLFRNGKLRLGILFIAALTELCWFQYSGGHLLRRDFIGKF